MINAMLLMFHKKNYDSKQKFEIVTKFDEKF